ncbi:putative vacuolar protein 8 [Paratrimastix pyriformis]|uniref:Vacuolar protein 8 n=1 Tax=Paratrimastix pyriformis TaxID=342808 RepID=A0ABQ8UQA5_9EUKA|nr:putative vacuolar protein 8 [Paratrimastix pyriformis]
MSNPETRSEPLKILWMATQQDDVRREFRELGGIEPILEILCAENVPREEKVLALRILCNLSFDDENNVVIRALNGVGPILSCLQPATDIDTTRAALRTLCNLSINESNKDEIRSLGGIPAILACLDSSDTKTRRDALRTLCNLSINPENKAEIVQIGGLQPVISCLTHGDVEVRKYALASLINLSSDESSGDVIRELNGLGPILERCSEQDIEARRFALRSLCNLSISPPNKVAIGELGGIPVICAICSQSDDGELRCYGLATLMHLALNEQNNTAICRAGVLPAVLDHLGAEDPDTQRCALGALSVLCSNEEARQVVLQSQRVPDIVAQLATDDLTGQRHAVRTVLHLMDSEALVAELHRHNAFQLVAPYCTSPDSESKHLAAEIFLRLSQTEAWRSMVTGDNLSLPPMYKSLFVDEEAQRGQAQAALREAILQEQQAEAEAEAEQPPEAEPEQGPTSDHEGAPQQPADVAFNPAETPRSAPPHPSAAGSGLSPQLRSDEEGTPLRPRPAPVSSSGSPGAGPDEDRMYRETINQLQRQVQDLKAQRAALAQQLQEARQQDRQSPRPRNAELEGLLKAAQDELARTKGDLEALQAAQHAYPDSKAELAELREEVARLRSELQVAGPAGEPMDVQSLVAQLENARAMSDSLQAEVRELEQARKGQTALLKRQGADLEQLRAAHEQLKGSHGALGEEAEAARSKVGQLEAELASQQRSAALALAAAEDRYATAQRQVEVQAASIATLEATRVPGEAHQRALDERQAQVDELRAQLEGLAAEADQLRGDLAHARQDLAAASQREHEGVGKVAVLEQERHTLQAAAQDDQLLGQRLKEADLVHQSDMAEQLRLQQRVEQLGRDLTQATALAAQERAAFEKSAQTAGTLREELTATQERERQATDKIGALERELEALHKTLAATSPASQVAELQAQLERQRAEHEQICTAAEERRAAEAQAHKSAADAAEAVAVANQAALAERAAQLADLQAQLHSAQEREDEATRKIAALLREVAALQQQPTEAALADLRTQLAAAQAQAERLQDQLVEAQRAGMQLRNDQQTAEELAQARLQAAAQTASHWEAQARQAEGDLAAAEGREAEAALKIGQLEAEVASLNATLSASAPGAELVALRAQLEEAQRAHQAALGDAEARAAHEQAEGDAQLAAAAARQVGLEHQLQDLHGAQAQTQAELAATQERERQATEKIGALERELEALHKTLAATSPASQVAELQAQLERQRAEHEQICAAAEERRAAEAQTADAASREHQRRAGELEDRIRQLDEDRRGLLADLAATRDREAERPPLERMVAGLGVDLEMRSLTRLLCWPAQGVAKIGQLEAELTAALTEVQGQVASQEKAIAQVAAEKKGAIDEGQRAIAGYQADLDKARRTVGALEGQLQDVRAQLAAAQEQLAQTTEREREGVGKVETLLREVSSLQETLAATPGEPQLALVREQLRQSEARAQTLGAQADGARTALEERDRRLAEQRLAADRQAEALRAEVDQCHQALAAMKDELAATAERERQGVAKCGQLEGELAVLNQTLAGTPTEQALTMLRSQLAESGDKLAAAERRLVQVSSEATETRVLQERLAAGQKAQAEERIAQLEQDAHDLQAQLEAALGREKDATHRIGLLEEELATQGRSDAQTSQTAAEGQRRLAEATAQLAAARRQADEAQAQRQAAEESLRAAQAERDQARKEAQEQAAAEAAAQGRCDKLREEVAAVTAREEDATRKIAELQDELATVLGQRSAAGESAATLTAQLAEREARLREEVRQLTETRAALTQDLEAARAQLAQGQLELSQEAEAHRGTKQTLAEVQERYQRMVATLGDTNATLQETDARERDAAVVMAALRQELSIRDQHVDRLTAEGAAKSRRQLEVEAQVAQLTGDLEEARQAAQQAQAEATQLAGQVGSLRDDLRQYEALRQGEAAARAKIDSLEREIGRLAAADQAREVELAEGRAAKAEVGLLKGQLAQADERANERLLAQVAQLTATLHERQDQLVAAQGQLQELQVSSKAKIGALEEEVARQTKYSEQEVAQARAGAAQASEATQAATDEARRTLEAQQAATAELRAALEAQTKRTGELEEALKQAQADQATAAQRIDQLNQELRTTIGFSQGELRESEAKVQAAQAARQEAAQRCEALDKELAQCHEQLAKEAHAADLMVELGAVKQELEAARAKIRALQEELRTQIQYGQQETDGYQKQVAELTEALRQAGEEGKQALAAQIALEEKIVEVTSGREKSLLSLQEMSARHDQLAEALTAAQAQVAELQSQGQQKGDMVRAGEAKMDELRTEIERLNTRIAEAAEAEQRNLLQLKQRHQAQVAPAPAPPRTAPPRPAPPRPAPPRPVPPRPATSRPATSRPATSRPATFRPATSRPATSRHVEELVGRLEPINAARGRERDLLQAEFAEKDRQLAALRDQLAALRADQTQIAAAEQKLAALEHELQSQQAHWEDERARLGQEKDAAEAQAGLLQAEVDAYRVNNESASAQHSGDLAELREALQVARHSLAASEERVAVLEQEHVKTSEYLHNENAQLHQEAERLRAELAELGPCREQMKHYEEEIAQLARTQQQQVGEMDERLHEAMRTSQDKIATLEQELHNQLEFAKAEGAQHQRQVHDLEEQVDGLLGRLHQTVDAATVDRLKEENARLQAAADAAEQKLRSVSVDGTASGQRILLLQEELDKQAAKFEADTAKLTAQIGRLQNEVLEAQTAAQAHAEEARLAALPDPALLERIEASERQIVELQKAHLAEVKQIQAANERAAHKNLERLRQAQDSEKAATSQVATLQQELERVTQGAANPDPELGALREATRDLQARLEATAGSLKAAQEQLAEERDGHARELDRLKHELDLQVSFNHQSALEKIAQLENELRAQNEYAAAEVARVKGLVSQEYDRRLQQEADQHAQAAGALQAEVERLRGELAQQSDSLAQKIQVVAQLEEAKRHQQVHSASGPARSQSPLVRQLGTLKADRTAGTEIVSALEVLAEWAAQAPENRQTVRRCDGVRHLVDLLHFGEVPVVKAATQLLAALAQDDQTEADVRAFQGYPALAELLSSPEQAIRANSLQALLHLARPESVPDMLHAGALPPLVLLLHQHLQTLAQLDSRAQQQQQLLAAAAAPGRRPAEVQSLQAQYQQQIQQLQQKAAKHTGLVRAAVGLLKALAGPAEAKVQMRKLGGLKALVDCLAVADVETVRAAMRAISLLSSHPDNRAELRVLNGLGPILGTLRASEDLETQRAAMGALINLSVNAKNKAELRALGGLQLVGALFQETPDPELRRYGVRTLCNLALNEENKLEFAQLGIVPVLVRALGHEDSAIFVYALRTLSYLATQPACLQALGECGMAGRLVGLLGKSIPLESLRDCATTLALLAARPEQAVELHQARALAPVVRVLETCLEQVTALSAPGAAAPETAPQQPPGSPQSASAAAAAAGPASASGAGAGAGAAKQQQRVGMMLTVLQSLFAALRALLASPLTLRAATPAAPEHNPDVAVITDMLQRESRAEPGASPKAPANYLEALVRLLLDTTHALAGRFVALQSGPAPRQPAEGPESPAGALRPAMPNTPPPDALRGEGLPSSMGLLRIRTPTPDTLVVAMLPRSPQRDIVLSALECFLILVDEGRQSGPLRDQIAAMAAAQAAQQESHHEVLLAEFDRLRQALAREKEAASTRELAQIEERERALPPPGFSSGLLADLACCLFAGKPTQAAPEGDLPLALCALNCLHFLAARGPSMAQRALAQPALLPAVLPYLSPADLGADIIAAPPAPAARPASAAGNPESPASAAAAAAPGGGAGPSSLQALVGTAAEPTALGALVRCGAIRVVQLLSMLPEAERTLLMPSVLQPVLGLLSDCAAYGAAHPAPAELLPPPPPDQPLMAGLPGTLTPPGTLIWDLLTAVGSPARALQPVEMQHVLWETARRASVTLANACSGPLAQDAFHDPQIHGVGALIKSVRSETDPIARREVLHVLRALATASAPIREDIRQWGGVGPLVECLRTARADPASIKYVMRCLTVLSATAENRQVIVQGQALPTIVELIAAPALEHDLRTGALGVLINLALSGSNKALIREQGGLPPLVGLLQDSVGRLEAAETPGAQQQQQQQDDQRASAQAREVLRYVVHAIANLSYAELNEREFVKLGLLPALFGLLRHELSLLPRPAPLAPTPSGRRGQPAAPVQQPSLRLPLGELETLCLHALSNLSQSPESRAAYQDPSWVDVVMGLGPRVTDPEGVAGPHGAQILMGAKKARKNYAKLLAGLAADEQARVKLLQRDAVAVLRAMLAACQAPDEAEALAMTLQAISRFTPLAPARQLYKNSGLLEDLILFTQRKDATAALRQEGATIITAMMQYKESKRDVLLVARARGIPEPKMAWEMAP